MTRMRFGILIAAAAARTRHIKLGPAVASGSYHFPLRAAEGAGQLAHKQTAG